MRWVCGGVVKFFPLVFLGYVGWAAGNFLPDYVLGETPTFSGSTWTDSLLVKSCLAPVSGSQNGSF